MKLHLNLRTVPRLRIVGTSIIVLLTAGIVVIFYFMNSEKTHGSVNDNYRPARTTLIYFEADAGDGHVDLSWSTAAELNNDYFTIERSSEGTSFDEAIRKTGAGNSMNTLHYSAADDHPLPGNSYYRLKQTDYDGHFTYSEIKTVNYKSHNDDVLKIASIVPNPFSEKFTVRVMLKRAAAVDFQLINSSGNTVFRDIINANAGMNQFEFVDRIGLPQGIYFICLLSNDETVIHKVIKN